MSLIIWPSDGFADEFFEAKIRPLLIARCLDCHSGERTEGGLSLEDRQSWMNGGDSGPAIVPGDPDRSLVVRAIRYQDPELQMPPEDHSGPLEPHETDAIIQWITAGAEDPRRGVEKIGGMRAEEAASWWSFQPLKKFAEPEKSEQIDNFINAGLASRQLEPTSRASKRTLIRRATYDLTGLPPTPDAVAAFVADDSPGAFSRLVDHLLASPDYGRHWGRHWLDVVRYADTAGENTDRPLPHAWRYRNWVIDSLNQDLPYDQFIRMQIAGDLLPPSARSEKLESDQRNEAIVATGYLAVARRFGHDIDKDIHLTIEDIIDNIGKNFLGLTLGCARCHDHKYDPISDEDYYALYGIFASTKYSFPGCEPKGQPRDLVPLHLSPDQQAAHERWQFENEQYTLAKKAYEDQITANSASLQPLLTKGWRRLAEGRVGESQEVTIADSDNSPLMVDIKAGEALLLTILANNNHGADSTLVDWLIEEVSGEDASSAARSWSTKDLIDSLTESNPRTNEDGSTWTFLEIGNQVRFLTERANRIHDAVALSKWSLGDTPSVFVNRSDSPVTVWTQLPGRSFFVHPGPSSAVAVLWTSPHHCRVRMTGRVADAHPAGLDGISFYLDHFPAAEIGNILRATEAMAVHVPNEPAKPPAVPVAYAAFEGEPQDVAQHLRGDPEKPGDVIPRRWLALFGGNALGDHQQSGRLQLAEKIVEHPLAARVMANRLWQWHFGEGIVRTPNDFGSRGESPTHPALLDWLAGQFVATGYSIKAMHRLIMNSETYQRSSFASSIHQEADPSNRYLSRFSRRRLTAEELRDTILFCSERLDSTTATSHPFPAEASWTFTQHNPFAASYETNHRSVYLMIARQRRDPFLSLFDGADPNSSTPQRQSTTVPTQALYFLNNPFVHANAIAISERATSMPEDSRLSWLMKVLLQRPLTEHESDLFEKLLREHPSNPTDRFASLVRVIVSSNEFLYID